MFFELGIEKDETLVNRIIKPHKLTLLHEYIFAMIRTWQSRDYRKNPDAHEQNEAQRLAPIFSEYRIPLTTFPTDDTFSESEDEFYNWFVENEDSFERYWTIVTDEIFHITFSNRRFLERFGASLAEYIRLKLPRNSTAYTLIGEKVARPHRYPSWLKKAIFYRDHGRCVFCMCDLSGLVATDRRLHLDHIVPLNQGGSNDPSNFQLLCAACNIKKSDGRPRAGTLYVPWWEY
ncbi:HNH endonuclease [Burkholderia sp. HI2714]|uniref:HNH endonuclease n=1 Tax=Burkholderia sp. HI2714 TaxID=2015359 RepID=UPI0015C63688|nr:HNH endonuclease [Burkholderia sp. HI2714]